MQVKEDRFWLYRRKLGDFWRLYKRSSLGKLGLVIVLSFVIVAVAAAWIAPYNPFSFVGDPFLEPSSTHIFGTDQVGRDIFSRVVYGTRISLLVGLVASAMTVGLGTFMGLVSGYLGGKIDNVLMRITDLFIILPALPLMLIMAAILERNSEHHNRDHGGRLDSNRENGPISDNVPQRTPLHGGLKSHRIK